MAERIELKGQVEIARIHDAGLIVYEVLQEVIAAVAPGVTTLELDQIAARATARRGAKAAFLGYRGYPASVCISVNDEVVHGIPSRTRILKEGDIVGLDFGVSRGGFFGDSAYTVPVGRPSPEAAQLMDVTRRALELGIEAARPDGRLGDIGSAIQGYVEAEGFSVVRDFVGHGIGRNLHEPPQVPNYGRAGTGVRLRAGMVLAIEPMVNAGVAGVKWLDDGWTVVTQDRTLSAHFEHTIAITDEGPRILTLPLDPLGSSGARTTFR